MNESRLIASHGQASRSLVGWYAGSSGDRTLCRLLCSTQRRNGIFRREDFRQFQSLAPPSSIHVVGCVIEDLQWAPTPRVSDIQIFYLEPMTRPTLAETLLNELGLSVQKRVMIALFLKTFEPISMSSQRHALTLAHSRARAQHLLPLPPARLSIFKLQSRGRRRRDESERVKKEDGMALL